MARRKRSVGQSIIRPLRAVNRPPEPRKRAKVKTARVKSARVKPPKPRPPKARPHKVKPPEVKPIEVEIKLDKELKKAEKAEKAAMKAVESLEIGRPRALKIGKWTFEISKNFMILLTLDAVLVASMLLINFFMFRSEPTIFSSINLIAGFVFIFPIVMMQYSVYRKRKEIEELFPIFLRDFVEAIRGGMTVPRALKSVSRNDYKSLNAHVKKMAVQLDWGIPVEKALVNFSKRSKSKLIARIISSVRESHRFGGNLADTLEALSNTAVEVERLRQERSLYLHSQMITGYIIFFVFLAVIVALEKFLVPSLAQVSSTGYIGATPVAGPALQPEEQINIVEEYRVVFRNLILLQGFFAGLSVGKMAEGAVVAGMKHSLFMMFIGSVVFTIAA